ncbi:MAG: AMIN domain-containing protein, partial [Cyanobacteria bacterium P01_A01_bin.37]
MKLHLGLAGIIGSCAASVLISQSALAAGTEIQSVQVNESESGIVVTLESSDGDERPQIFTVSRGNTLVADMINTSLSLPSGDTFFQENPAPGISAVSVIQLDENSVRITVNGIDAAPVGQVQQNDGVIVFNFDTEGTQSAAAENLDLAEVEAAPIVVPEPEPQESQVSQIPPLPDNTDVLIPDPTVRIDGNRVSQQLIRPAVPPTQPRAVAPPVGDIATGTIDITPSRIDIGTQEILPRLVLRDAPVREVLALLARAAGLNLAYTGSDGSDEDAEEVTISLDVENEPIEDVFNYVVRLSGIQVSRYGRTIFAGPQLPNSARDVVARSLRLNQVDAVAALQFLVAMGAEVSVSQDRQVTVVDAVAVNEGGNALTQTQTFVEPQITTLRTEYQDSNPILRGLVAVGDERTNSVTLIGEPRLVQIA